MKGWKAAALSVGAASVWSAMTVLAAASNHAAIKAGNVTDARVIAEAPRGRNWLVLGGNFGSQHYSPLRQINAGNVRRLGPAWVIDIGSPMGLATEPIVVDGTLYATA